MNPSGQPFGAAPAAQPPRNDQLNLAAILLIVTAGLAIAYALLSLTASVAGGDGSWALAFIKDEALKQKMREAMAQGAASQSKVMNIGWPLLMMMANGFIIFGALKMKNAQGYPLALTAAILSTIPCCFNGCCCITSMPAGIFALVLLLKPEVKSSFTS